MGEWEKVKWGILLASALVLAGCGAGDQVKVEKPSEFMADCPEPGEREKLGPGDTFRDLARAHAEAVNGWQLCRGALKDLRENP